MGIQERIRLIAMGIIPGRFFAPDDLGGVYDLPPGVGDGADPVDDDPNPDEFDGAGAQGDGSQLPRDDSHGDQGIGDGGDRGAPRSGGAAAGDRGAAARGPAAGGRGGEKPESVPMHRFEALEQRIAGLTDNFTRESQRLQTENRRLRTALGLGEPPQRERSWSPREQKIRSQLFNMMPEFAILRDQRLMKLLERAQDLDRIAQGYPETQQAENRRWGGHAERMVRQVLNHAATQWHGQGKTLKDLDDDDKAELDDAFVRWVSRKAAAEERTLPDGYYGETTLRYEAADPTLVTEFWTFYTRRHGGAAAGSRGQQRTAGVAADDRAAAARRTVRGGSTSQAVGSAAREVKPKTVDQALDEGWSFVQQQRAGA